MWKTTKKKICRGESGAGCFNWVMAVRSALKKVEMCERGVNVVFERFSLSNCRE